MDEFDKAIEEYTKVIRLETNSAEKMIKVQAYWGRANSYLIRDIDEIIELYDRVDPYLEKGELDKAIEELTEKLEAARKEIEELKSEKPAEVESQRSDPRWDPGLQERLKQLRKPDHD